MRQVVSTVVLSSDWAQKSDDSSSMVEAASSAVRIFEYLFVGSQYVCFLQRRRLLLPGLLQQTSLTLLNIMESNAL